MFTTITKKAAHAILEAQGIDFDWGWDPDGVIYLAEEDVCLKNFEIGELHDDAALYIFKKNLTVDEWMVSYDIDYAPALAVFGDFKAQVCSLSGNGYYFLGRMDITKMLSGKYNHGYLVSKGPVKVPLIFSDDFQMDFYHAEFEVGDLVGNDIKHSDKVLPSTQNSWDIFLPDLVYDENSLEGHCMLEDGMLYNRIIENQEFLKGMTNYRFDPEVFLATFQDNDKLVEEEYISFKKYGIEYNFGKHLTSTDGKHHHTVYIQYYRGYSFLISHCLDDQTFTAVFYRTNDSIIIPGSPVPCNLMNPQSIAERAALRGLHNALTFLAEQ